MQKRARNLPMMIFSRLIGLERSVLRVPDERSHDREITVRIMAINGRMKRMEWRTWRFSIIRENPLYSSADLYTKFNKKNNTVIMHTRI
jgi:hypothetical protein